MPFRLFFRRLLLVILLFLFAGLACAPRTPPPPRAVSQTLYLALDGAPYSMMEELRKEGYFKAFQKPVKVIAPFPSTSVTGFGGIFEILGAETPPGYDAKYFSWEKKKEVGSLLGTADDRPGGYQSYFDLFRGSTFRQLIMYTFPKLSGRWDLKKATRLIWNRSDQRNFFVYIGTTEAAGHILGREAMKRWLIFLDGFLNKLREDYQKTFHQELQIVLFSDHGFQFGKLKPISNSALKEGMRRKGLRLSDNLLGANELVAVSWGNISAGSFYTAPEHVADAAQAISSLEGTDLVFYPEGDKIIILSSLGEKAEIDYDKEKNRYRYHIVTGDPLQYGRIVESLQEKKKFDPRGYAADSDWFEATKDHAYPDALFRIRRAFFGLVENPATLLFSTKENYEFGDWITRIGASLHGGYKGTHGALFDGASAAMVISTDPQFSSPPVIRYSEVMKYFHRPSK